MPDLELPDIPCHELLDRSAARFPDKDAIRFHDTSISFARLRDLTHQMSHVLSAAGAWRGDRIAIALYTCPDYIVTFYAASRLGAIVVPLNPSYKAPEALHVLRDSGARVLVGTGKMADTAGAAVERVIRQDEIGAMLAGAPPDPVPPVELDVAEDVAMIQCSSGTTGRPRGVMMTHRNLVASHLQYVHAGGVRAEDVSLVFVPFTHAYGTVLMGGAIAAGATQVLMERYHLETSLDLVERHRVTLYYCTTAVVVELVQSPLSRRHDLSSLRYINSGGAPLPPEVRSRAHNELGIAIANGYGMTEAPIVGHRVPGEERRIVDPDHPDRICGPNEPGEIQVRGPHVMKGYWNDPEGTAEALHDGWLRTGDIGFIDERGRLFVTARAKEMIKYKGFAVSPSELEGILLQHPSVADCAVVGKPSSDGNELPKAFVVLRRGASPGPAVEYVNRRVAEYKKIREISVVPEIPRNDNGKILKRLLVEAPG